MTELGAALCANCGAMLDDAFCSACGEKRVTAHDYSLAHFTEHLLETLAHVDFKSPRAVKLLVLEPGMLTHEFLAGRRKRYVGPLQLFVIMNVLFALFGSSSFRTPLAVQEQNPPFQALKSRMVSRALSQRAIDREAFAHEFDQTAGAQAKTWIFAMIPAFALCLALLYGFKRYFFEHLVFATHFYSFTLLWMLAAWVCLTAALRAAGVQLSSQRFDNVISAVILAGLAVYLFIALRRAYRDGPVAAAARAIALVVLFFPILLGYRFLLFFVTLTTMH